MSPHHHPGAIYIDCRHVMANLCPLVKESKHQIVDFADLRTPSVLDLENTLGGDPGPGLGADSDFDKRQLERVRRSWLFKIQWICFSSLLPGGLRQPSSGPESFCPGSCPRS